LNDLPKGGLSEAEIAGLAILYAANEVLFPTTALDIVPGLGKVLGRAGEMIKAGVKAEDATKIAIVEAKAAGQMLTPLERSLQFESTIYRLPAGERVALVKQEAKGVAEANGLVKDSKLSQLNGRDVYKDSNGNLYALDTQHGRWETATSKGVHQGEVNLFTFKTTKPADTTGGHNLRVN
jgi:Cytotoxic